MSGGGINLPGYGAPTWRGTVMTSGDLPSLGNVIGDIRISLDTFTLYVWTGSGWTVPPPGMPIPAAGSSGDLLYNSSGAIAGSSITTDGTNLDLNAGFLNFGSGGELRDDFAGGFYAYNVDGSAIRFAGGSSMVFGNNLGEIGTTTGSNLAIGDLASSGANSILSIDNNSGNFDFTTHDPFTTAVNLNGMILNLNNGTGSGGNALNLDGATFGLGTGVLTSTPNFSIGGGNILFDTAGTSIISGEGGSPTGVLVLGDAFANGFGTSISINDSSQSITLENGGLSGGGSGTFNLGTGFGTPYTLNMNDGSGSGGGTLNLDSGTIQGPLSFFGASAVSQQTGGAATAGAVYTSTEQGMLNAAYSALRAYGLLT